MNKQELIQEYLRQLEQEENLKAGNTYDKLRGYSVQANRYGNNLSTAGNFFKENVNNEVAKKIGTSMSNLGGNISKGATSVSNTLNKPVNYFKGHANRAVGEGLSKIGSSLAGNSGAIGSIGQSLSNLGSSMAGTGATTAAGTTAAGTAAGASAAGAAGAGTAAAEGGAAAAGAGTGAATGGAAAGGSAAGTAAAAGLVALGIMAATGANRKRAKKSGQALMGMTNDIVKQGQESALQDTLASTAALQESANQSLGQGIVTGGAAPIESNPIAEYQQYLKQNGYSDNVVNGVAQGLNNGDKEIADWINQYNGGAVGQANPIKIPQTEEEIAAARAGSFNTPTQIGGVTSDVKQGILDKFLNGITDFSRGYNENINTAFNPDNLGQKQFQETITVPNQTLTDYQQTLLNKGFDNNVVSAVAQGKNSGNKEIADWISKNPNAFQPQTETKYYDKSKMGRLGEVLGTVGRAAQTPAVQALIAGGLSTALTGNPLYGLGMAQKFGNARAMSNIYQKVLAEQGIEANPVMFGSISAKDFDSIMLPELKKVLYANQAERIANDRWYKEHKLEIDERNADSKAVQAEAAKTRANKYNGVDSKISGKPKPESHPDWGSDLAGYYQRLKDPSYAGQITNMKAAFIQKYRVDPDKYIKSQEE